MTENKVALSDLSDEDLVARFRKVKSDSGGADPALTPHDGPNGGGAIRAEMERRGLAPDREDLIPDDQSPRSDPIVEDDA